MSSKAAPAPVVTASFLSLIYPALVMAVELLIPRKASGLRKPGGAAVLTDTDHTNENCKRKEPEFSSL